MWKEEELYTTGDGYFESLFLSIQNAKISIDVEVYIYASDEIGEECTKYLIEAAERGVRVRIIVDGIGSAGWLGSFGQRLLDAGAEFMVYNKLPWDSFFAKVRGKDALESIWQWLLRINNRSHRKIFIIDSECAYAGSRNVTRVHSERYCGPQAWRDLSVRACGDPIADLSLAFERVWIGRKNRRLIKRTQFQFPEAVRLNIFRKIRLGNFRRLCSLIAKAKHRVWVETGYFLPHRLFVKALTRARNNGADVCVIVPEHSDVFFFPSVSAIFQKELLKAGIKVYRFERTILHTKAILIDDIGIVGSSNVNQRSLLHDLEVDLVLTKPETIEVMRITFESDKADSRLLTLKDGGDSTVWQSIVGHVALLFRYFL